MDTCLNIRGVQHAQVYTAHGKQARTRLGRLWSNLKARSRPAFWIKNPTYAGCSVGFTDFQAFAMWAVQQYGYDLRDGDGRWYELDKDLLRPGNKVYSPELCLFVPKRINNLFIDSGAIRGEYPTGVSLCKGRDKYQASCQDQTGRFSGYIGKFNTPEEAHIAYLARKLDIVEYIYYREADVIPHEKLRAALLRHINELIEKVPSTWGV